MFWGPDLVDVLQDDAYRPVLGGKHPAALGAPIREVWAELWPAGLKEMFDSVLTTGDAFWAQDLPFFLERHGYPEETYFDGFVRSYARRVRARGRRVCHRERNDRARGRGAATELAPRSRRDRATSRPASPTCSRTAATVLGRYPEDLPFALCYARVRDGGATELVGSSGLDQGDPAASEELAPDARASWPFGSGDLEILEVEALGLSGSVPCGRDRTQSRIRGGGGRAVRGPRESPTSWLVAGISPRRRADEAYRELPGVVATNLGGGGGRGPPIGGRAQARRGARGARPREDNLLQQRQSRVPHAAHADCRAHRRPPAGARNRSQARSGSASSSRVGAPDGCRSW